jgi:hypothetical protein
LSPAKNGFEMGLFFATTARPVFPLALTDKLLSVFFDNLKMGLFVIFVPQRHSVLNFQLRYAV